MSKSIMKESCKCPICGSTNEIDALFCSQCGWEFRIFPDNVPEIVKTNEERRIASFRDYFDKNRRLNKKILELNAKIDALNATIDSLKQEHKRIAEDLKGKLKQAESELKASLDENEKSKTVIQDLNSTLSSKIMENNHILSDNSVLKEKMQKESMKYKEYISPEDMASFKAGIKSRIDKLYDEIAYQKSEIERLRKK